MVRKYQINKIFLLAAILLSSCKVTETESTVPALLKYSSPETRRLLEQATEGLLNSTPIKLADNVFTKKSTVIIDRKQPSDSRGNLLDGREVRLADTLSLLTKNGNCYLKHDQSGHTTLLEDISCKAK